MVVSKLLTNLDLWRVVFISAWMNHVFLIITFVVKDCTQNFGCVTRVSLSSNSILHTYKYCDTTNSKTFHSFTVFLLTFILTTKLKAA